MAYNEYFKERVERIFRDKNISVEGKKMMGGYCFMLNDKMCVGVDTDQQTKQDRLIVRVGEENMEAALRRKGCRRMEMSGRQSKGFVLVDPDGFDYDKDLDYWIQASIDYNPKAKSSRKK